MIDTKVVHALLAKMTESGRTIANANAIKKKAEPVGGWLIEIEIRLGALKILRDHGAEIPNEAEVVTWVRTHEEKLKGAKRDIVAQQLAIVVNQLGVTPDDKKAARSRREKIERDRRRANGDCVGCPKDDVKRAVPGSTRCEKCGRAHNVRSRTYRQNRKEHEGARRQRAKESGNTSGGDNVPRTTRAKTTDATNISMQPSSTEPTVDAPASAHQVGPERSDTGARPPFLTRIKQ